MKTLVPTQQAEALEALSAGERRFVLALLDFTHQAQHHPDPELARAAKRWDSLLRFRVGVTIQERRRRERARALRDATARD